MVILHDHERLRKLIEVVQAVYGTKTPTNQVAVHVRVCKDIFFFGGAVGS